MKKSLLLAVALMCCAPTAFAQNSVNEDATVDATVIQALAITKNQDLNFGRIAQGTTNTIAKADAADVAKFSITGEAGESVTITYTEITELDEDGAGTATLPYTQVASFNDSDDSSASTDMSGGTQSTTLEATNGTLFVYLSGTVTPGASQTAGAYSATVNVAVAY